MANKKVVGGMLGMVLAFGLVLSGCATNVAIGKSTNFERREEVLKSLGTPKYTILGPVILEKDWFGVLGFSTQVIPIPKVGLTLGGDLYFYQSGGITYVDLLTKARETYADADAVIDINLDHSRNHYFIFYGKRTNIMSGIAIKYSRDVVSP